MFIIDNKGILRQITINDRPVGRCVPETFRLIRAIQQAARLRETTPKSSFPEGKTGERTIHGLFSMHIVTPSSIEKPRLSQSSTRNLLQDLSE